jgi:hypothetical protein
MESIAIVKEHSAVSEESDGFIEKACASRVTSPVKGELCICTQIHGDGSTSVSCHLHGKSSRYVKLSVPTHTGRIIKRLYRPKMGEMYVVLRLNRRAQAENHNSEKEFILCAHRFINVKKVSLFLLMMKKCLILRRLF